MVAIKVTQTFSAKAASLPGFFYPVAKIRLFVFLSQLQINKEKEDSSLN